MINPDEKFLRTLEDAWFIFNLVVQDKSISLRKAYLDKRVHEEFSHGNKPKKLWPKLKSKVWKRSNPHKLEKSWETYMWRDRRNYIIPNYYRLKCNIKPDSRTKPVKLPLWRDTLEFRFIHFNLINFLNHFSRAQLIFKWSYCSMYSSNGIPQPGEWKGSGIGSNLCGRLEIWIFEGIRKNIILTK